MKIAIETTVNAPLAAVWQAWVSPEAITQWNFASDDWWCPKAEVDLRQGGRFSSRMEAQDGSMGFDFSGEFTAIKTHQAIEYALEDGRKVNVTFTETDQGVRVEESFDAEDENSAGQQEQGWQAILNNFKQYVENQIQNTAKKGDVTMQQNPISWFEIYVDDMPRAKKFYEAVLKISLEKLDTPSDALGDMEMQAFPSSMDLYGASGSLVKMKGFPAGGNSTLVYFGCEDCAVEESRVADAGGKVTRGKISIGDYGFISLVVDTEGNMIGLHSMS